ncbi:serine/threonine protein kinase [Myxococcota bacterium]|nr:serine/threonine protein kinase [Myxococcota bacterium]
MLALPTMADGRYLVGPVLGRGGMATVYAVLDRHLGLVRAAKVMEMAFLRSEQARERFQREARTMARLQHPHVLPVHDLVVQPHLCLMVCDLAWHGSLRARLDRAGPLPLSDVVALGQQLLSALHAAHQAGVVHRDVKPSNILLDERGAPRLADFGVVRLPDLGGPTLTRKGATLGTRAYMAPEQQADATDVDGRADLFALGRTLLKAALGPALGPGVPLRDALGQLPPRLALAIGGALHPDRAQRPPDALAMAALLEAARPDLPPRPAGAVALAERSLVQLQADLWRVVRADPALASTWSDALAPVLPEPAGKPET